MKATLCWTVGLALVGGTPQPSLLLAQEAASLRAGARIRVRSQELEEREAEGRLLLLDADTLVMSADSVGFLTLSLARLERLEVSRGRNPAMVLGGVALGGVAGALLGPVVLPDDFLCELDVVDDPKCKKETPDAVIGAAVGAVVLGVLSHAIAKERWVRIPRDCLELGIRPSADGGLRLSASLRLRW